MKKNCCDTKINEKKAQELLTENGLSRTKVKIGILTTLSKSKKPLSANEIHEILDPNSCNISTVFRSLTQFKEKGLVNEINLGEDFFRYGLIDLSDKNHHHHHVRCRDCGDIKLIEQCDLSAFEKMISKLGFKKMEHYLEFTGICAKCS